MKTQLIITSALFLLAFYAPVSAKTPTDDELVKDFIGVAYTEEGVGISHGFLRKFETPIRVRIEGAPNESDKQRTVDVVTMAASVTGHDIRMAQENEGANFFVYFSTSLDPDTVGKWMAGNEFPYNPWMWQRTANSMRWFKRLNNDNICSLSVERHQNRPDLAYAHAFIYRFASATHKHRCIAEEILQGLGLLADTKKHWPSIFSDSPFPPDPSEYDLLYLRILYDPRVRAGMTEAQVAPRVREILQEVKAGKSRPPPLQSYDPLTFQPTNELLLHVFMDQAVWRWNPVRRRGFPKWVSPIRVRILDGYREDERRAVEVGIRQLREVLGLDINISGPDERQNAMLDAGDTFDPKRIVSRAIIGIEDIAPPAVVRDWYQDLMNDSRDGTLYSRTHGGSDYVLRYYAGFLYRHPDFKAKNLCPSAHLMVLHEFRFRRRYPWYSVSSAGHDCDDGLSAYDLLFLRMIYDPRVTPGMAEADLTALAAQLLSELRPDETVPPDLSRLHLSRAPGWRRTVQ